MSEDSTYSKGDKVTISRGKNAGKTGIVQIADNKNRKLALTVDDELVTTTYSNVKVPDEPTVTESQLNSALIEFGISPEAVDQFMTRLFGAEPDSYDERAVN